MEDEDFLLALRLQEQFDRETVTDGDSPSSKKRRIDASGRKDVLSRRRHEPERPLSIVDEAWETLDPNPDARAMFLQFNDMFFWGKLTGVEVKWSPRMTLCAGVCSYEGRGGLCSIRLSEPLLKLRPRKDLVETLLHEMIHALLFVTQNDRDRDGHGPEFCKHMNRINQASGTHISVYHSFHDEVDVYRQHWWRCDGPCQNRKPFFGYVKRAMNRPPSARDPWWPDHRRTCGGTYTKVKEPENYGKKNKREKSKDAKPAADSSKTFSSAAGSGSQDIRNIIPFSGRGFLLGGNAQQASSGVQPEASFAQDLPSVEESGINEYKRNSTSESNVFRKKSVSNTKAFININGSPVRVSKANSHTVKQKTVLDLFSNVHVWSPEKRTSTTITTDALSKHPAGLKRQTPTSALDSEPVAKSNQINNHPSSSKGPKPASNEPFLFKYFKTSDSGNPEKVESRGSGHLSKNVGRNWNLTNNTLSSSQGSISSSPQVSTSASESGSSAPRAKKRPWEEHNSPPILDYFQPVSKTSRSEVKQEEETPLQISVCCPVCHTKVPENTINQHLDSCLS